MKLKINGYQELTAKEAKSIKGGTWHPCDDWYEDDQDVQRCKQVFEWEHCNSTGNPWMNDRDPTEAEDADLYPCY